MAGSSTLKAFDKFARGKKQRVGSRLVPDRNEEYFFYQTLLAHMPFTEQETVTFGQRLLPYLVKAMREAKEHSNWLSPDAQPEQVYCAFADRLLKPGPKESFLKTFTVLWKRIARLGMVNSLSQTLLKITAPGLPDFYQGTELWDFSMVDPDNRRPVDFTQRQKILTDISAAYASDRNNLLRELMEKPEDGRIKLFLTWKGLGTRRDKAELFQKGQYHPLEFAGPRSEMFFGFVRALGDDTALAIVPRLFAKATGDETQYPVGTFWDDTNLTLPGAGLFVDVFTGREFPAGMLTYLKDIFKDLPFSLLVSRPPGSAAQG